MMHTYGNLEYMKDEIDVGGASTSSYIHPYAYRATHPLSSRAECERWTLCVYLSFSYVSVRTHPLLFSDRV